MHEHATPVHASHRPGGTYDHHREGLQSSVRNLPKSALLQALGNGKERGGGIAIRPFACVRGEASDWARYASLVCIFFDGAEAGPIPSRGLCMKHPVIEVDGIAVFRMSGQYSFEAVAENISYAIIQAVEQGHDSLLVDCIELAGFQPPSIPARHEMVRQWAAVAQGRVRVAIVICGEFIDAEKFGVIAAANFGLMGNVFKTVSDARDWLRLSAAASVVPDPFLKTKGREP